MQCNAFLYFLCPLLITSYHKAFDQNQAPKRLTTRIQSIHWSFQCGWVPNITQCKNLRTKSFVVPIRTPSFQQTTAIIQREPLRRQKLPQYSDWSWVIWRMFRGWPTIATCATEHAPVAWYYEHEMFTGEETITFHVAKFLSGRYAQWYYVAKYNKLMSKT